MTINDGHLMNQNWLMQEMKDKFEDVRMADSKPAHDKDQVRRRNVQRGLSSSTAVLLRSSRIVDYLMNG